MKATEQSDRVQWADNVQKTVESAEERASLFYDSYVWALTNEASLKKKAKEVRFLPVFSEGVSFVVFAAGDRARAKEQAVDTVRHRETRAEGNPREEKHRACRNQEV